MIVPHPVSLHSHPASNLLHEVSVTLSYLEDIKLHSLSQKMWRKSQNIMCNVMVISVAARQVQMKLQFVTTINRDYYVSTF